MSALPDLRPTDSGLPADIAEAIEILELAYVDAGITIGDVRQHVVAGEVGALLGRLDLEVNDKELPSLLQLSAGAADCFSIDDDGCVVVDDTEQCLLVDTTAASSPGRRFCPRLRGVPLQSSASCLRYLSYG